MGNSRLQRLLIGRVRVPASVRTSITSGGPKRVYTAACMRSFGEESGDGTIGTAMLRFLSSALRESRPIARTAKRTKSGNHVRVSGSHGMYVALTCHRTRYSP